MICEHIEHTLLKPEASAEDIIKLCQEAKEHHFLGVCVNPCYVSLAKHLLAGSQVKVVTVIGFPLGCEETETKALSAARAIGAGADELDMVIHVGALKDKDDAYVTEDIRQVVLAAGKTPVKVIIETCLLSEEEKVRACQLIAKGGAVEDVALLAAEAKKLGLRVKAAGGIRDYETAQAMLAAGAERLGCSAGVQLAAEEAKH